MTRTRKRTLVVGTAVILLAGVVYGCQDFLVSPPQGTLDELSLANQNGVEATLIGAYRLLGGWTPGLGAWGAASSNWPFGSVTSDDAYKGSDAADQAPITDVELYNWGSGGSESYLNDKWRSVYEGVTRSNATIRLLDRVEEETPDEISDADAAGIRGEALFLRAHYHFEAWKMWGNIPYYTEADTDFRKPNTGAAPIPLILADLETAIGLLEETPRNGHAGRVSAWTARAYKGRVQVYSGDYAGGLTTLREVESAGPYDLQPDYHQVWTGFRDFANGPETILAYQASVNDGNPNGDNANWGERLNFPHAGSPFGCCGFHQPSQNLVNFFVVDGAGLPVALSDADWNVRDANLDATATVPVDPRLDWTVGRDGVPYKDWGTHAPDWIRDRGFGGPYNGKKNVHENASGAESNVGWNAQHLNSMNIHLFRYADMLLLLAEAEVEAGNPDDARIIVNRIRARAGVVAQGPGTDADDIAVPIDDPSITWADYEIGEYPGPWDQEFARQAVRYERRLELAMEGHRFFDLRRWGIAEQVINEYIAEEATRRAYLTGATPLGARHSLYPIPAIQIELSRVGGEDRLVQNPEW
jgi:hypothetical protein